MFNAHIGEIFETNSSGKCKIIALISGNSRNNARVKIIFENTNYEKIAKLNNVISGNVRDNSLPNPRIINIDYNKVYESINGPYKIIKEAGKNIKDGARMVEVMFLNTNNTQICRAYRAMRGQIKDQKLYDEQHNVIEGKIYSSNNYGDFVILKNLEERLEKYGHKLSKIKFIKTGTIVTATHSSILAGSVYDPYYPSVCGVACIGNALSNCREYNIWHNMIKRCYDKNHKSYKSYGGIGVTVDDRWKCFEYFLKDFPSLPGYNNYVKDPLSYCLDKDYLQLNIPKNERVYSKYTCILISYTDNSRIMVSENNKNASSKFIGVTFEKGIYRACITINGKKKSLGEFTNEIAAANAYNMALKTYTNTSIMSLYNDVPYMSPAEIIKYNNSAKEMIKIIN